MASTKKKDDDLVVYAAAAVLLIFSVFHYFRLRQKYLTNENAHQIFDFKAMLPQLATIGALLLMTVWMLLALLAHNAILFWLALPLCVYAANLAVKAQAYMLLGVVIDYNTGIVHFPPNLERLGLFDYLKVIPVLKVWTALDSVEIDKIERITRQAGKSLFMIGTFGSRRITFTDKGKRDECIYWLTSFEGSHIGLANEMEFSE
jgi:hypothetical protein